MYHTMIIIYHFSKKVKSGALANSQHEKTRRGGKEGGQKFPFPRPLSFFARPLFLGVRGGFAPDCGF